tara:strand:+ start:1468 stop:1758 length:291 start_codon:yes stop_codon:yes gene_type:complete
LVCAYCLGLWGVSLFLAGVGATLIVISLGMPEIYVGSLGCGFDSDLDSCLRRNDGIWVWEVLVVFLFIFILSSYWYWKNLPAKAETGPAVKNGTMG